MPDGSWLTNHQAKIAHYFGHGGHSACHLWMATTLDRPAPANVPRCPTCRETVARESWAASPFGAVELGYDRP